MMDDLAMGRLLERVEQIAAELEGGRQLYVPREVCALTHTRIAADDVALRQRVAALESAQIADAARREQEARERAAASDAARRARWAMVVSIVVALIAAAATVVGAIIQG